MKRKSNLGKKLVLTLCILLSATMTFGHSGRTDSNGGHKDNKNKSGLGSYHYHCGLDGGGYPAHLHTNGCPYANTHLDDVGKSTSSSSSNSSGNTKSTPKYTEKKVTYVIDGEEVQINTINVNNTNLAELKTLSEKLGITIAYDSALKSIDCTKGSTSFTLQIDSKNFWKDAELSTLEVAPVAYNGRTMIPARVVAEAIGKSVSYDASKGQIIIQ